VFGLVCCVYKCRALERKPVCPGAIPYHTTEGRARARLSRTAARGGQHVQGVILCACVLLPSRSIGTHVEAIVAAMVRHPESALVQRQACGALRHLLYTL
jgi:hypothetical protein